MNSFFTYNFGKLLLIASNCVIQWCKKTVLYWKLFFYL